MVVSQSVLDTILVRQGTMPYCIPFRTQVLVCYPVQTVPLVFRHYLHHWSEGVHHIKSHADINKSHGVNEYHAINFKTKGNKARGMYHQLRGGHAPPAAIFFPSWIAFYNYLSIIMPRCACASEVYGSVFVCVCVCVCVCVDCYSCWRINEVQVRVSIRF